MNLEKLFAMQKELRNRINYNEPDRFNKLVLALLVELGECANEQRSWKFWSKQQTPKVYGKFKLAEDGETLIPDPESSYTRVLEEYVDGLHFVLELGIELEYPELPFANFKPYSYTTPTIEDQFLAIYEDVTNFKNSVAYHSDDALMNFDELVSGYVGLGKMLGFTWEEIEQAYMEKNKVNHQRQSEGY